MISLVVCLLQLLKRDKRRNRIPHVVEVAKEARPGLVDVSN